MKKDWKRERGKLTSRVNAELIPKENALRNEAIIGFWEYASKLETLKKQKKDVPPEIMLGYFLREHREWFVPAFLNPKSSDK